MTTYDTILATAKKIIPNYVTKPPAQVFTI